MHYTFPPSRLPGWMLYLKCHSICRGANDKSAKPGSHNIDSGVTNREKSATKMAKLALRVWGLRVWPLGSRSQSNTDPRTTLPTWMPHGRVLCWRREAAWTIAYGTSWLGCSSQRRKFHLLLNEMQPTTTSINTHKNLTVDCCWYENYVVVLII